MSLSEYFSIGAGLNYIKSNLARFSSAASSPLETISADLGLVYHYTIGEEELDKKWEYSAGLSIQNIGPKISYSPLLAANEFLPTNLQLGFMLGHHLYITDESDVVVEFAYQISKLLVPSQGNRSDKGALGGMLSSFGDASDVGGNESQEYIHQLGLETRFLATSDLVLALRTGLFLEHTLIGTKRYSTAGLGVNAYGVQVDMAYIQPFKKNHPFQNTFRFGLSFLMDKE